MNVFRKTILKLLTVAMFFCSTTTPPVSGQDKNMLDLTESRRYMLELINRDRKSQGLKPVHLDPVATIAGQDHSNEMARLSYLSHWDTQGRKPDQRYTEAGGRSAVFENAHIAMQYVGSELKANNRRLRSSPRFSKKELESIESDFFDEKPPNDLHRRNILDPNRNMVGIGLSIAYDRQGNTVTTCAQEFVNHWGLYSDLPKELAPGQTFVLSGRLDKSMVLKAVDIMYEDLPNPLSIEALRKRKVYGPPNNRFATYFPNRPGGLRTWQGAAGQEFSISITPDKRWRPGLYYFWIWATRPADGDSVLISSRAIPLPKK